MIRARTLYTHHTRIQLQVSEQNLPAQCELYTALPPHRRLLPHLPLVQRLRLHAHTHTHTRIRSHIGIKCSTWSYTIVRPYIGNKCRPYTFQITHWYTFQITHWYTIQITHWYTCQITHWYWTMSRYSCVVSSFVIWAVLMSTVSQRGHFLMC